MERARINCAGALKVGGADRRHTSAHAQTVCRTAWPLTCGVLDQFGCILAELYTGYPPGENEVEQLACIMEIFGLPSPTVLGEAQRKQLFFGETSANVHFTCLRAVYTVCVCIIHVDVHRLLVYTVPYVPHPCNVHAFTYT